jgi:hypothetical protein
MPCSSQRAHAVRPYDPVTQTWNLRDFTQFPSTPPQLRYAPLHPLPEPHHASRRQDRRRRPPRHCRPRTAATARQALKMYPWICGRCAREFTLGNRVSELTVHHKRPQPRQQPRPTAPTGNCCACTATTTNTPGTCTRCATAVTHRASRRHRPGTGQTQTLRRAGRTPRQTGLIRLRRNGADSTAAPRNKACIARRPLPTHR